MDQRKHIFFSGAAGTGKSALIAEIVRGLRRQWPDEPGAVCVTAPTSLAAIKAGGQTMYAWAGIGPSHTNVWDHLDAACQAILRQPESARARSNWSQARVLIIDEVSMVTCDLLDLLDKIGRRVRAKMEKRGGLGEDANGARRHLSSPFGGIQIIMCGDFLQLPPITERAAENTGEGMGVPTAAVVAGKRSKSKSKRNHRWAFYAECWQELFGSCGGFACRLTEVFRQTDSGTYLISPKTRTQAPGSGMLLTTRIRRVPANARGDSMWDSLRKHAEDATKAEPAARYRGDSREDWNAPNSAVRMPSRPAVTRPGARTPRSQLLMSAHLQICSQG